MVDKRPGFVSLVGGLAVAIVLTIAFLRALYLFWLRIQRPPHRHAPEATCPSILLPSLARSPAFWEP
jgi:hypothetical protein